MSTELQLHKLKAINESLKNLIQILLGNITEIN